MSHVTNTNEACHTYVQINFDAHWPRSSSTFLWNMLVSSHICTSHVTHMHECSNSATHRLRSYFMYLQICVKTLCHVTHIMSHVTYTNGLNTHHFSRSLANELSNTLQHTAIHCNTLQYTATPCNTLQHTATHCYTLLHTATHCNTLQHTAAHCSTLQHTPLFSPADKVPTADVPVLSPPVFVKIDVTWLVHTCGMAHSYI